MKPRLIALALLLALPVPAARADVIASRVIVSATLDSTLHVFDAGSLGMLQPPLPSKGTSPVRLWVQRFGGRTFLLSANHGVQGSVGVFDLDGPLVIEAPLSPFPSGGQGSVGVVAGTLPGGPPAVFVTDTVHALGGCGLPHGSVSAFDASLLASAGVLTRFATGSTGGSVPYAVALDERTGDVLATNSCNDEVVSMRATPGVAGSIERTGSATTGDVPDAIVYDGTFARSYVVNIGGDSADVFESGFGPASTTVPLPGAGPIDATIGGDWLITSNGDDDTVSLIDRATVDACVAAAAEICDAEVARIFAGVRGGAPEGVAYDPVTHRVFVVNKTIGAPALSVIQLSGSGTGVTGGHIATIPLRLAGGPTPVPSIIAFDVVVQPR